MSIKKRRDEDLDQEYDFPSVPTRANRSSRGGSSRLRTNSRTKAKSTKSKNKRSKVGGIHQRANKRMSW